jgi:transposase-like protein
VSKNGKTETDIQRYICNAKECAGKSFMLEYSYNGCKPGIDKQIIDMTSNASGIRDISRNLKISTDKVMSTLKKQKK